MWLWNFAHSMTPFHVYELLAMVLGGLMAIAAAIHLLKGTAEAQEMKMILGITTPPAERTSVESTESKEESEK